MEEAPTKIKKKKIPYFKADKKNRKELATYLNKGMVEVNPEAKKIVKKHHILKNINQDDTHYSVTEVCSALIKQMIGKHLNLLNRKFSTPQILIIELDCYSVINQTKAINELLSTPEYRNNVKAFIRLHQVFAKHKKIDQQADEFAKTSKRKPVLNIVISTPNRLMKLVDLKILDYTKLKYVILDCTPNTKKQCLLDHRDTRDDVLKLIGTYFDKYMETNQIKFYFQ